MDNQPKASEEGGDLRSRIIEAATVLFCQHGFARTSTSQIVALARTSKRAIYANFTDKHAILEAVLDRFITRRFEAIGQLSRQSSDPRIALDTIAQGLLKASTDEITMAMYRVLFAELDHFPDLSERADTLGLQQAIQLLHKPLAELGVADHETAAKILYDLLVLAPLHRRMIGARKVDISISVILNTVLSGFIENARDDV